LARVRRKRLPQRLDVQQLGHGDPPYIGRAHARDDKWQPKIQWPVMEQQHPSFQLVPNRYWDRPRRVFAAAPLVE
jgi:hypothetical protein